MIQISIYKIKLKKRNDIKIETKKGKIFRNKCYKKNVRGPYEETVLMNKSTLGTNIKTNHVLREVQQHIHVGL